jgi:hypothetical protein
MANDFKPVVGHQFHFGLSRHNGGMELLIAKFSMWMNLISYHTLGLAVG